MKARVSGIEAKRKQLSLFVGRRLVEKVRVFLNTFLSCLLRQKAFMTVEDRSFSILNFSQEILLSFGNLERDLPSEAIPPPQERTSGSGWDYV